MRTIIKKLVNEEMAKVTSYAAGTGTAEVLDNDGCPIGEMIEFEYQHGQFLWTDGDSIEWDGPYSSRRERLEDPTENSLIVFTRDDTGHVNAWTYETEYHECVKYASFVQFRIVNDQGTVLWAGLYSDKHDELIAHNGQRPKVLEEGMVVEFGDNPYGTNPYSADVCWSAAHNQEQFWGTLVKASKRK